VVVTFSVTLKRALLFLLIMLFEIRTLLLLLCIVGIMEPAKEQGVL